MQVQVQDQPYELEQCSDEINARFDYSHNPCISPIACFGELGSVVGSIGPGRLIRDASEILNARMTRESQCLRFYTNGCNFMFVKKLHEAEGRYIKRMYV